MYKPETITALKQFYESNKTQLEYLKQYKPTQLQKMQASYIIKIANGETQNLENQILA